MTRSSTTSQPMHRVLTAANGFAVVFCLIWLVGHSTIRVFDWEFWFALGFLLLAVANAVYFTRTPPPTPEQ